MALLCSRDPNLLSVLSSLQSGSMDEGEEAEEHGVEM